jgi:hypothetical protein
MARTSSPERDLAFAGAGRNESLDNNERQVVEQQQSTSKKAIQNICFVGAGHVGMFPKDR